VTKEALPPIPSSWIWAELGDVLSSIEAGKSFKCEERPPNETEVGIVKVSAVTWGTFDADASKTCLSSEHVDPKLFIQPGDFLFSRANTIQLVGACVIVEEVSRRLMLSDKILRLRFQAVEPRWLLHVLRTSWGRAEIERLATGNQESMRNIGQDRIRALRVPLPPLAEQRRIVAEIENQFKRLDAGTDKLIQATSNIERLADAAVEFEMRPEFIRRPMGDVCDVQGGIQKQPTRRPASNAHPFLRVANVFRNRLVLDDIHKVELFPGELERLRLIKGDLLIVEGNGSPSQIGRMALWDGSIDPCVHQNHIIRARTSGEVLPAFVAAYWNSPKGRRAVGAIASSTSGLYTLSVSKINSIPIPVPPIAVQHTIVERIQRAISYTDRVAEDCQSLVASAARLRQAILKKAFEGNLVPQDPNDEPASVLLERVRAARLKAPEPRKRKVHA
jgi:type I restriction enzyme S subunit